MWTRLSIIEDITRYTIFSLCRLFLREDYSLLSDSLPHPCARFNYGIHILYPCQESLRPVATFLINQRDRSIQFLFRIDSMLCLGERSALDCCTSIYAILSSFIWGQERVPICGRKNNMYTVSCVLELACTGSEKPIVKFSGDLRACYLKFNSAIIKITLCKLTIKLH